MAAFKKHRRIKVRAMNEVEELLFYYPEVKEDRRKIYAARAQIFSKIPYQGTFLKIFREAFNKHLCDATPKYMHLPPDGYIPKARVLSTLPLEGPSPG